MTPEQWRRARDIFSECLIRPPEERRSFLLQAVEGDPDMLAHVELLLAGDAADSEFLSPPGISDAALSGTALPCAPSGRKPRAGSYEIVAGRYRLICELGRGATSVVHQAHDLLADEQVALKLLRSLTVRERAVFRRETAILRLLRIPGIVTMLDEGRQGEDAFLVMALIKGEPFPGPGRSWSEIEQPTLALLETLSRLHRGGIVHRDLKPENILVGPDGATTVLDLGIAREWRQAGKKSERLVGTPRFLAPEQLRGEAASPQSDLYAVGVMLFETLTGHPPHTLKSFSLLIEDRRDRSPEPVCSLAPEVPAHVGGLIDRFLAMKPSDRPVNSESALRELRTELDPPGGRWVHDESEQLDRIEEIELRKLFSAPDRLLHIPTDAAEELYRRTGGAPSLVAEEIESWRRAGLARRDGGRVWMERLDLDRLTAGGRAGGSTAESLNLDLDPSLHLQMLGRLEAGSRGRLFHVIAAGAVHDIPQEALATAAHLVRIGRIHEAWGALGEGLYSARQEADAEAELEILESLVKLSLRDGTTRSIDLALYHLSMALAYSDQVASLEGLARSAYLTMRGDATRALGILDEFAFEDPDLERFRHSVRVVAARYGPPEQESSVVAEATTWAESRSEEPIRASGLEWAGWLLYRRGDYLGAATSHRGCAELAVNLGPRISALLNAASALMEAGEFDPAMDITTQAKALAESCRHPMYEARAEWLLRSLSYRSAQDARPDTELIAAAECLEVPWLEGAITLNEAAVAWRRGESALAAELASRAAESSARIGRKWVELMSGALAAMITADIDEERFERLLEMARACPVPGIAAQSLGMLALARPRIAEGLRAEVRDRALKIPKDQWNQRREILSINEALLGT